MPDGTIGQNPNNSLAFGLISWLEKHTPHVAVNDLPKEFLNPDLLTVCGDAGWIEFCDPINWGDGPVYSIWNSWTGPDTKPIRDFLHEVLAIQEVAKRPHVRTTGKGRAETARARMEATPDGASGGDGGTASPAGGSPIENQTPKPDALSGEEKALALLVKHSEWSDTKIAKAVPCHRTTLYKWDRYMKARAALKSGKSTKPKGSKSGETGDVEAWESDDS